MRRNDRRAPGGRYCRSLCRPFQQAENERGSGSTRSATDGCRRRDRRQACRSSSRLRAKRAAPRCSRPSLEATDLVSILALATRAQDSELSAPGAQLTTAGWGTETPTGDKQSKVLKELSIQALASGQCEDAFPHQFLPRGQICTEGPLREDGPGHQSACYGDSGGPAVATSDEGPVLVGIASYVRPDGCGTSAPTVYTRVAKYGRFIAKAVTAPRSSP